MNNSSLIEYESLAKSNTAFMAELEQAATRVIRSGWYVLGQEVSAFEAEFAQYSPSMPAHAIASAWPMVWMR
jgi:dTDP-4-amino-4,6-dideoxygalactose transaminase